ncbi:MAG: nicotinamide riboside transporter PnuC [Marinifilaceae bacterium]
MSLDLWIEYIGVVAGLAYLLLEILQRRAMWVVGVITSLLYIYVFYSSKFYADMGLNIYYVIISIYGFIKWRRNRDVAQETFIRYVRLSAPLFMRLCMVITMLYLLMYYILENFTDSPVAMGDAFTTALSIVATWMLAKRIIEHWIFWIIINIVSAYLYYSKGLYPTVFLFVCYTGLAVVGWFNWKRKGELCHGQL